MALDNPNVANLVVAPIDRTAAAPAIAFGGDSTPIESSGTAVLEMDATGPSFTGDLDVDGEISATGDVNVGANLVLPESVVVLVGDGAPVDGTTGDNVAGPGSMYVDYTNANLYIQVSLITTPAWKLVTRAA